MLPRRADDARKPRSGVKITDFFAKARRIVLKLLGDLADDGGTADGRARRHADAVAGNVTDDGIIGAAEPVADSWIKDLPGDRIPAMRKYQFERQRAYRICGVLHNFRVNAPLRQADALLPAEGMACRECVRERSDTK